MQQGPCYRYVRYVGGIGPKWVAIVRWQLNGESVSGFFYTWRHAMAALPTLESLIEDRY